MNKIMILGFPLALFFVGLLAFVFVYLPNTAKPTPETQQSEVKTPDIKHPQSLKEPEPEPEKHRVTVLSDIEGAIIYANGEPVGKTGTDKKANFPIERGEYTLSINKETEDDLYSLRSEKKVFISSHLNIKMNTIKTLTEKGKLSKASEEKTTTDLKKFLNKEEIERIKRETIDFTKIKLLSDYLSNMKVKIDICEMRFNNPSLTSIKFKKIISENLEFRSTEQEKLVDSFEKNIERFAFFFENNEDNILKGIIKIEENSIPFLTISDKTMPSWTKKYFIGTEIMLENIKNDFHQLKTLRKKYIDAEEFYALVNSEKLKDKPYGNSTERKRECGFFGKEYMEDFIIFTESVNNDMKYLFYPPLYKKQ